MKLYFYVFDGNKLEFSECEAKERPKSYLLEGKVRGFYNRMVLKSEIGLQFDCEWKQIVILDKRGDDLAKQHFSGYLNREIDKKKKEVDELMKKLKYVSAWEADHE